MTVVYNNTDATYTVSAVGAVIKTTVTDDGRRVCDWIDRTLRIHRFRLNNLIVGFDLMWCANGFDGYYGEQPICCLQLCVGHHCLVLQLIHCVNIPDKLKDFLLDHRFRFVGWAIRYKINKLHREYGLQVGRVLDIGELAASVMRQPEVRQWGLQTLAREIMRVDMERPWNVWLTDWQSNVLSMEQIEYVAVEAFVSFDVARRLDVLDF